LDGFTRNPHGAEFSAIIEIWNEARRMTVAKSADIGLFNARSRVDP
jgi:hypothetical protein